MIPRFVCTPLLHCANKIQNTCTTPFTEVKSTTFLMLCAALCPFCGFAFPLRRRSVGLLVSLFDASVGASRCFSVSVALLSGFGWAPLFLLPCCLSLVGSSLSVVAFPPPRLVPFGALVQFLLVPPSGYLVAAVTA